MSVGSAKAAQAGGGLEKAPEFGLFIGGKWVKSSSSEWIETRAPATGKLLARFANGNRADTLKAIETAEAAFAAWSHTPPPRRGEILLKAAQVLRARKEELGHLVSEEM